MTFPRRLGHELMDAPDAPPDALRSALAYLRSLNALTGGRAALVRRLDRWSAAWPRDRTIRLLDIGTGSGDIPLAACEWARRRGIDLRVTAVDSHPTTLAIAREHTAREPRVEIIDADARTLEDRFPPGRFDYAHAALFLHHLETPDVVRVLRAMHRLTARGVVWSDLVRSRLQVAVARATTVGQGRMVRHDAVRSVEAGFTRREAGAIASEAGIDYAAWSGNPLWYRFVLAGERPSPGWSVG